MTWLASRPWWPWTRRIATAVFFGLIAWLLFEQATTIQWSGVLTSMKELPSRNLFIAAALCCASYLVYSCFDLFGRYYTAHSIRRSLVMVIAFTSYLFNLNFGTLVGGVALRYRLYSRFDLSQETITRIVSISMFGNWIGYLPLAGSVFVLWPLDLPPSWKIGPTALQSIGYAMLAVTAIYLAMCASFQKKTWSIRNFPISLPPLRLAVLQIAMSCLNWSLMGSVVYFLLQERIPYPAVLGVLLAGAIAGVITHVPAGLGVLEAVFVALLSRYAPAHELLAGVLAYRALYYLCGLLFALAFFAALELGASRLKREDATAL